MVRGHATAGDGSAVRERRRQELESFEPAHRSISDRLGSRPYASCADEAGQTCDPRSASRMLQIRVDDARSLQRSLPNPRQHCPPNSHGAVPPLRMDRV